MKFFTLFLSLLFALSLSAQTGILSGRVIDESKLPLPGATVMIDDLRGTIADADGFYSFVDLPEGNHLIKITFIGFNYQGDSLIPQNFKLINLDKIAPLIEGK